MNKTKQGNLSKVKELVNSKERIVQFHCSYPGCILVHGNIVRTYSTNYTVSLYHIFGVTIQRTNNTKYIFFK